MNHRILSELIDIYEILIYIIENEKEHHQDSQPEGGGSPKFEWVAPGEWRQDQLTSSLHEELLSGGQHQKIISCPSKNQTSQEWNQVVWAKHHGTWHGWT